MSKLALQDKFLDLSDYGRPFGTWFANLLKNTKFTPIHVTFLFGLSGIAAVVCILNNNLYWAGFFIILKSAIDAADGELARLKKTPSYTGRYLDSVFDIFLNFFFLMAICFMSTSSLYMTVAAFICIQLQGTLYNYYYVILRNRSTGGDTTSRIFESKTPTALPGETQRSVDILFTTYKIVYGAFDKSIYFLDKEAHKTKSFPNWFMTCLSVYGLGFQLLIITVMMATGFIDWIVPFFIAFSALLFVLVGIRKRFLTVEIRG